MTLTRLLDTTSLTTVRAGPHTAVRRVELGVNSQAFCIMRVARRRFGPCLDAPRGFTPTCLRKAKLLAFRPRVVPEIARCTRHSLPFGPSITVPGLAYLFLHLSALECLHILAHCMTYFALG